MTIPQKLKRYYASAPDNLRVWQAVEIRHSTFGKVYRFTDNPQGLSQVRNIFRVRVDYETGPISIQTPTQDGAGRHQLGLVVAAVEEAVRAVVGASRDATSRMRLTYYQYFDGERDPAITPTELQVVGIEVDPVGNRITLQAAMPDLPRRPFPSITYRPETFPGLDRT